MHGSWTSDLAGGSQLVQDSAGDRVRCLSGEGGVKLACTLGIAEVVRAVAVVVVSVDHHDAFTVADGLGDLRGGAEPVDSRVSGSGHVREADRGVLSTAWPSLFPLALWPEQCGVKVSERYGAELT